MLGCTSSVRAWGVAEGTGCTPDVHTHAQDTKQPRGRDRTMLLRLLRLLRHVGAQANGPRAMDTRTSGDNAVRVQLGGLQAGLPSNSRITWRATVSKGVEETRQLQAKSDAESDRRRSPRGIHNCYAPNSHQARCTALLSGGGGQLLDVYTVATDIDHLVLHARPVLQGTAGCQTAGRRGPEKRKPRPRVTRPRVVEATVEFLDRQDKGPEGLGWLVCDRDPNFFVRLSNFLFFVELLLICRARWARLQTPVWFLLASGKERQLFRPPPLRPPLVQLSLIAGCWVSFSRSAIATCRLLPLYSFPSAPDRPV